MDGEELKLSVHYCTFSSLRDPRQCGVNNTHIS